MAISIGNHTYDKPLFMAPMEGITDVPFRKIVRKHGCDVICTQMVHAKGLLLGTQSRMETVTKMVKEEQPVGFQLAGSDAQSIAEAGKKAQDMGAAFIDLNMGCPAKNVVKRGAGSALLKTPDLVKDILNKLSANISIPVTVKIRLGWDKEYGNGFEVAKIAQEHGASLVSVHGRTRAQRFKGKANWDLIAELKKQVDIPVVGNGDVFAPEDIDEMFKITGADGVMAARGALGNPWLFAKRRPTVGEIRETLFEHMDEHLRFYPNIDGAMVTFRKHIVWYTKGLANAHEFRKKIFKLKDLEIVTQMLNEFFDQFDPSDSPDFHEKEKA